MLADEGRGRPAKVYDSYPVSSQFGKNSQLVQSVQFLNRGPYYMLKIEKKELKKGRKK